MDRPQNNCDYIFIVILKSRVQVYKHQQGKLTLESPHPILKKNHPNSAILHYKKNSPTFDFLQKIKDRGVLN